MGLGVAHTDCDIVVIGAGVAGAGVAADLSKTRRVVVLEQEAQPGFHATGRSAALHSEVYGNACIRALTQASRDTFLRGAEGRVLARPRGCIHIAAAHQVERLEAFAAEAAVGPVVTRLGPDQVRARVPILKPGYVQAALAEDHAYDLDVDAIHHSFLARHRRKGGSLICSSPVTGLSRNGGRWHVAAGGQEFRAPVVVNAAGAWGDRIAALAGASPVGLEPRRRSALIVDPPAGSDPSAWSAVIDIDEQFYFKPEAGRILLSPADETPSEPCDAYPEELDLAVAVERVQRAADLPIRRIAHSWAGLRTFAPDRTPVVGYDPRSPGFFWLVGQGGYGIQTSPALSRLAAALIEERPIPIDLAERGVREADLSPARFQAPARAEAGVARFRPTVGS
jgi:D-arginine dehydrogenase